MALKISLWFSWVLIIHLILVAFGIPPFWAPLGENEFRGQVLVLLHGVAFMRIIIYFAEGV